MDQFNAILKTFKYDNVEDVTKKDYGKISGYIENLKQDDEQAEMQM